MQDIAPFFDIVIVIAAVVTPAIVLVRLVRGGEEGSLANLFAAPDYNAWPRGVQEEEPQPVGLRHPCHVRRIRAVRRARGPTPEQGDRGRSPQPGSVSQNVVQPPSLLTPTRPPAASTSWRTIASPIPAPPRSRSRDFSTR